MEQKPVTLTKTERLTTALLAAAVALLFAAMAVIALSGLVCTCSFDPAFYENQEILYTLDNIPLNLLVLLAVFALCVFLTLRFPRAAERIDLRLAAGLSLLLVAAMGATWVLAADCPPQYDSRHVTLAAAGASRGDFSLLQSDEYFRMFPYQLGYVFLLELQQRLLGAENFATLGLVNVLCLVLAYAALLRLTKRLFPDRRVLLLTCALLPLFLQGPLFCTFLYGNVPGLCAVLWGMDCLADFLLTGRKRRLLPAALLLALAVLAKPNYWIAVLAAGIVTLLHLLCTRRWQGLAAVLVAAVLASGSLSAVTARYERLAEKDFGPGTPQTAWLVTGLHGSYMAPGWYNGYTDSVFADNDFDVARTKAQLRSDLAACLEKMKNPVYTAMFFGRKLLSQFEETSFHSVFVSKNAQGDKPVPALVDRVYRQDEAAFLAYFDYYMQAVYVFAAAGFFLLLRRLVRSRRGLSAEPLAPGLARALCLLPVMFFGGFLYHMIFEGKSQYILVYIPLLLPYAAWGLLAASDAVAARLRRRPSRGAVPAE